MKRSSLFCAAAAALGMAGCTYNFGLKPERSPGIDAEISQSERNTHESRTLSHLAALEISINDYIKGESKIPEKLNDLIPKYLAELPSAELGLPKSHGDTAEVEYYSPLAIRSGVVDGSQLKDTGKWGYVHNERQVIIFVDCTHPSSRGKLWYQERGVF